MSLDAAWSFMTAAICDSLPRHVVMAVQPVLFGVAKRHTAAYFAGVHLLWFGLYWGGSPFIVTVAIEVLLVDALARLARVQSEDAHGKVDELWYLPSGLTKYLDDDFSERANLRSYPAICKALGQEQKSNFYQYSPSKKKDEASSFVVLGLITNILPDAWMSLLVVWCILALPILERRHRLRSKIHLVLAIAGKLLKKFEQPATAPGLLAFEEDIGSPVGHVSSSGSDAAMQTKLDQNSRPTSLNNRLDPASRNSVSPVAGIFGSSAAAGSSFSVAGRSSAAASTSPTNRPRGWSVLVDDNDDDGPTPARSRGWSILEDSTIATPVGGDAAGGGGGVGSNSPPPPFDAGGSSSSTPTAAAAAVNQRFSPPIEDAIQTKPRGWSILEDTSATAGPASMSSSVSSLPSPPTTGAANPMASSTPGAAVERGRGGAGLSRRSRLRNESPLSTNVPSAELRRSSRLHDTTSLGGDISGV
eukprot:gene6244-5990_t